ncbi:hypothetical protein [Natrinema sp. DC36]|uniref:hypothetical protein n=1 Tax=Natrinema sp. DC36 TaxID=2878680 RepID=UPI001CF0D4A7|nr:hypothetical protein [Natrinema sp. DC36]
MVSDLVERFKEEFNAEEAYDIVAHATADDTYVGEDGIVALIPKTEIKFGVVDLTELESVGWSQTDTLDVDGNMTRTWRFEKEGVRHYVTAEYVDRILDVLGEEREYLNNNSESRFDRGNVYPVVIDGGEDYWFMVSPIKL